MGNWALTLLAADERSPWHGVDEERGTTESAPEPRRLSMCFNITACISDFEG